MTRRDYELIARALRDSREESRKWESESGVDVAAEALADALAADNPRFDRNRFLAAAGL